MSRTVLEVGKDFQADGIAGLLVDVDHAEILGTGGVRMVGKHRAGFRARALSIVHFVFHERMRRGDEATDALLAVDDPAFDIDLAELGTAGEQRFFQRAEERRVGQRLQGHDRGGLGEFAGERPQIGGGVDPARLQELAELVRNRGGIDAAHRRRGRADADRGAPDLDPAAAGIAQFQPQLRSAEGRADLQGEARVGQADGAAMALFDLGPGQTQNAEMHGAADHRADVAEDGAGLGQEPAADPRRFAGKDPRSGQLDIKNIGVVFVHATGNEPRQSPRIGASPQPVCSVGVRKILKGRRLARPMR